MSKSTYVVLAALVAMLTGCSGNSPAAPRTSATSDCLAPLSPTYLTGDGPRVALAGSGRVTVVVSPDTGEKACAWVGFAQRLLSVGYQVALYDDTSDPVEGLSGVVRAVRAHDRTQIVLFGAAGGAQASILAAGAVHPVAVVSLSADARLGAAAVAPAARALTAPILYATSSDDPHGSAATRAFAASGSADTHHLVVVPGTAHGASLLRSERVATAVFDFLTAIAPAADPAQTCGAGAKILSLPGPPGFRIDGLGLGSGATAAVFLHELGRSADQCGWWPFAYWLTHHYPVQAVLVNRCDVPNTRCPSPLPEGDALVKDEVAPAVAFARAHGARRVVLVGASAGGGDALEAAAVVPGVDAVVDLSGDQTSTGLAVQRAAARVRIPTFMAVATNDDNCPVPGFRRQYAAVPARTKRLQIVADPLGAHGWDLVFGVGSTLRPLATTVAEWIGGHYG